MISKLKTIRYEIAFIFIFIISRLPLLGFDLINLDAPIWKMRTFSFSSAVFSLNFADTAVTYHPGVVLMWLAAIGVKLYGISESLFSAPELITVQGYVLLHFFQKLMLIIFMSLALALSLYILRKLYSSMFVLVFFVLFTFEPYVVGLTRVLHTDGLVTMLSFLSVLSFYYNFVLVLKSKKVYSILNFRFTLWLILSAFATGLALLTKSNSLFLLAFIGLELFILNLYYFRKNIFSFIKNLVVTYLFWIFWVVITFIVFWPAMWVQPFQTLELYYSGITDVGFEDHFQTWFNVEVADPGYLFYPIVIFIKTTPWFLVSFLCGILLYFYGIFKYKKGDILFNISLLFIVLYLTMLSIPEKKLGRYELPTLTFLAIFGAYFIGNFITIVTKKYGNGAKKYFYLTAVLLALLLGNILSVYKIFPDYLMYYSPLVLGYEGGSMIEEPKWPIGYSKLARYLNDLPHASERRVLVRYGYVFAPFYVGPSGTTSQTTEKDPGVYFVLEKYSDWRYLRGKGVKQVDVISLGDTEYFWIYEIIGDYEFNKKIIFNYPEGYSIDQKFK